VSFAVAVVLPLFMLHSLLSFLSFFTILAEVILAHGTLQRKEKRNVEMEQSVLARNVRADENQKKRSNQMLTSSFPFP
jgi:nucleoside permease NupC